MSARCGNGDPGTHLPARVRGRRRLFIPGLLVAMAFFGLLAPLPPSSAKQVVIIDTDVGSYMDDSAAIMLALQDAELDVRLIVTATNDTTARARIVAKYLTATGRTDVPIGIGVTGAEPTLRTLFSWADDVDMETYGGTVHADGVRAMRDVIAATAPATVDIVAIAPPTNVAALLRRYGDDVLGGGRVRVRAMVGSVRRGYWNSSTPVIEYNAALCPTCTRAMFRAPWPLTITPLDSCGVISLANDSFRALLDGTGAFSSSFAESWLYYVSVSTNKWYSLQPLNSGPLLDTVAVALSTSLAGKFLRFESLKLNVTDDGRTVIAGAGSTARSVNVATGWTGDNNEGVAEFLSWMPSEIAGKWSR